MQQHWQRRGWLATLLRPLAALAGWHVRRRRADYLSGNRTVYRAPVPVIVVGNIYVGGTGKTPVVIALVDALRARGWTPGIVSRGYGARIGAEPRVGLGTLNPSEFGDEPALIAHTSGSPISVHPRRALAAQALLKQYPQTDVIVSDDGLQHLALARDVEIVVQDERGVGNGYLLPAGPLREPADRLDTVDVIITNRSAVPDALTPPVAEPTASTSPNRAPPDDATPQVPLAQCRSDSDRQARPRHVDMQLQPIAARQLQGQAQRPLSDFSDPSIHPRVAAAAGIGNPERFFSTLRAAGVRPSPCLSLPDHYDYHESPFDAIQADAILITSKDAIKCQSHQDARLWEIPVQAQFSDPDWFDWLEGHLRHIAR